MAQKTFTLSVKGATFPLLSEQQSRTVIGSSERADPGAIEQPELAYCHNVMPIAKGLVSVGYKEAVAVYAPAISNLSDVRKARASDLTRLYLAWDEEGRVYSLEEDTANWRQLTDTTPSTIGAGFDINDVTLGTVNGVTYIWYLGVGCFTYNIATHTLDSVTLTGISIPNTIGITAASGYLIAITTVAIAWSSTLDPTDFTPSTVTGAGGGNVAGIGGAIRFILPNTLGLLIHCDTNVIAGTYTGNLQYPFKFREADDSKGGLDLDAVAYEANSANQYAFTKAGLQAISSREAKLIVPDVADFMAGKRFEDFNESTKTYTQTDLTTSMKKKVKFIASIYLVISYGITSFTHAIVYDTALKRMGKLKITHVDCFEYVGPQEEVSKESIAFLTADGQVQTLDFSTAASSTGVAIFGKIQYVRSRTITLLGVDVETIKAASTLGVTSQVSLDGKTTTNTEGAESYSAEGIRKYDFKITALNHSIVFIGKFELTTVIITYILNGRR